MLRNAHEPQVRYEQNQPELDPEYVMPLDYDSVHEMIDRANIAIQTTQNRINKNNRKIHRDPSKGIAGLKFVQNHIDGSGNTMAMMNERFMEISQALSSQTSSNTAGSSSTKLNIDNDLMVAPLLRGLPIMLPSLYNPQYITRHAEAVLAQEQLIRRRGPGTISKALTIGASTMVLTFAAYVAFPAATASLLAILGNSPQLSWQVASTAWMIGENAEKAIRYRDYRYVTQATIGSFLKQGLVQIPVFCAAYVPWELNGIARQSNAMLPEMIGPATGFTGILLIQASLNLLTRQVSSKVTTSWIYKSQQEMDDMMYNSIAQEYIERRSDIARLRVAYEDLAKLGPVDRSDNGLWALYDVKHGQGPSALLTESYNFLSKYKFQFLASAIGGMIVQATNGGYLGTMAQTLRVDKLAEFAMQMLGVPDLYTQSLLFLWKVLVIPNVIGAIAATIVGTANKLSAKVDILRRVGKTNMKQVPGLGHVLRAIERQIVGRVVFDASVGYISTIIMQEMASLVSQGFLSTANIEELCKLQNMPVLLGRASDVIQASFEGDYSKMIDLMKIVLGPLHVPQNGDYLYSHTGSNNYQKVFRLQEDLDRAPSGTLFAVPILDDGSEDPDKSNAIILQINNPVFQNLYSYVQDTKRYEPADIVTSSMGFLTDRMGAGPTHIDGQSNLDVLIGGPNLVINAIKAGASKTELLNRNTQIHNLEVEATNLRNASKQESIIVQNTKDALETIKDNQNRFNKITEYTRVLMGNQDWRSQEYKQLWFSQEYITGQEKQKVRDLLNQISSGSTTDAAAESIKSIELLMATVSASIRNSASDAQRIIDLATSRQETLDILESRLTDNINTILASDRIALHNFAQEAWLYRWTGRAIPNTPYSSMSNGSLSTSLKNLKDQIAIALEYSKKGFTDYEIAKWSIMDRVWWKYLGNDSQVSSMRNGPATQIEQATSDHKDSKDAINSDLQQMQTDMANNPYIERSHFNDIEISIKNLLNHDIDNNNVKDITGNAKTIVQEALDELSNIQNTNMKRAEERQQTEHELLNNNAIQDTEFQMRVDDIANEISMASLDLRDNDKYDLDLLMQARNQVKIASFFSKIHEYDHANNILDIANQYVNLVNGRRDLRLGQDQDAASRKSIISNEVQELSDMSGVNSAIMNLAQNRVSYMEDNDVQGTVLETSKSLIDLTKSFENDVSIVIGDNSINKSNQITSQIRYLRNGLTELSNMNMSQEHDFQDAVDWQRSFRAQDAAVIVQNNIAISQSIQEIANHFESTRSTLLDIDRNIDKLYTSTILSHHGNYPSNIITNKIEETINTKNDMRSVEQTKIVMLFEQQYDLMHKFYERIGYNEQLIELQALQASLLQGILLKQELANQETIQKLKTSMDLFVKTKQEVEQFFEQTLQDLALESTLATCIPGSYTVKFTGDDVGFGAYSTSEPNKRLPEIEKNCFSLAFMPRMYSLTKIMMKSGAFSATGTVGSLGIALVHMKTAAATLGLSIVTPALMSIIEMATVRLVGPGCAESPGTTAEEKFACNMIMMLQSTICSQENWKDDLSCRGHNVANIDTQEILYKLFKLSKVSPSAWRVGKKLIGILNSINVEDTTADGDNLSKELESLQQQESLSAEDEQRKTNIEEQMQTTFTKLSDLMKDVMALTGELLSIGGSVGADLVLGTQGASMPRQYFDNAMTIYSDEKAKYVQNTQEMFNNFGLQNVNNNITPLGNDFNTYDNDLNDRINSYQNFHGNIAYHLTQRYTSAVLNKALMGELMKATSSGMSSAYAFLEDSMSDKNQEISEAINDWFLSQMVGLNGSGPMSLFAKPEMKFYPGRQYKDITDIDHVNFVNRITPANNARQFDGSHSKSWDILKESGYMDSLSGKWYNYFVGHAQPGTAILIDNKVFAKAEAYWRDPEYYERSWARDFNMAAWQRDEYPSNFQPGSSASDKSVFLKLPIALTNQDTFDLYNRKANVILPIVRATDGQCWEFTPASSALTIETDHGSAYVVSGAVNGLRDRYFPWSKTSRSC